MKLWIARDSRGYLGLYKDKPNKIHLGIENFCGWKGDLVGYIGWGDEYFPHVRCENSPKEVKLK